MNATKQLSTATRDLVLRHSGLRCVNTFVEAFGPNTTFRKARGHDALRVEEDGSVTFYHKGRKGLLCPGGMIRVFGKAAWSDSLKDFVAGNAY